MEFRQNPILQMVCSSTECGYAIKAGFSQIPPPQKVSFLLAIMSWDLQYARNVQYVLPFQFYAMLLIELSEKPPHASVKPFSQYNRQFV